MRRDSRDGSHFLVQINLAGRMVSSQTLLAGRLSQGSGSQHFWYQKYFAGRMVSSQTLLAIRLSQDSGSSALVVPEIFCWSNGF
jgi:hemin uptake protein HemP